MTANTIGSVVTLAGCEGTLLANRYRIVRQLGQGGMGSVWLAEDTQLDNRPFAIKMLPPVFVANRRAYRQLKDEALVAMKLTHPNIVTLRAFEENNGNPFLVMDYIDGLTLDNCLEEWQTLSEEQAVALLQPVADAIDYAHRQGVVHRDIKPGNIMVREDGTPFVLDFGISREMQETMTRVTGKLSSGTLLYMSPEQLTGAPPKKEQDVYSFAATVYECVKGAPPFDRGQIEYQILNTQPPPLPLGCSLAEFVMAGLEKDPGARPATCLEVLGISRQAEAGVRAASMPMMDVQDVVGAVEWSDEDEPLSEEDKRLVEALCSKLRKRNMLPTWLDERAIYDMPRRAVACTVDRVARAWMRDACRRGLRRYVPLFTRNDWSRWRVRAQNGEITSMVDVAIYEFVRDDDILAKAR